MSVYAVRALPCAACGAVRPVRVVQSANPTRHPQFIDELLDRTFNRFRCPACGAVEAIDGPMLWTDVSADLVALMAEPSQRWGWRELEVQVARSFDGPVRHEGPQFVQAWGRGVAIRLVFGLEELREKVVARRHRLRDTTIEVLKLPYGDLADGRAPVLESVDDDGIHFARPPAALVVADAPSPGERLVAVVPWRVYERRLERSELDAVEFPGLFAGTWVHWSRAPVPPLEAPVGRPA